MEKNLVVKGNGGAESQEHGLVIFNGAGLDGLGVIQAKTNADAGCEDRYAEEWAEAMSLLRDPDLVDILQTDIEKSGCVGDGDNTLLVYLTLTSRLLDDPLSLIVKGESAAGKSHEVGSVTSFFPDDQVLVFTRITPQALFYLEHTDLAHKALIIYERHGAEAADYPIRTLLSEKELRLLTVEKNKETGKIEGKQRVVKGPVAYIETTTKSSIHPENETRSFSVTVDDSETQTERIVTNQKNPYKGMAPKTRKNGIYKHWKTAQELLAPVPVLIPFVDYITFPVHVLRTRRDHKRFLSLIETVTVLHQYQRERKVIDGIDYIVATVSDYGVAYGLASKIIGQIFKRISQKGEQLVSLVSEKHLEENFNRKMLEDLTGWDKETVKKYISEAVKVGYFEEVDIGSQGRSFSYKLAKSIEELPAGTLISPEELRQKMAAENGEKGN